MAASVFRVEAASSSFLGKVGRDGLPERCSGNGASCPSSGAAFGLPALLKCRVTPERLLATSGSPIPGACNMRGPVRWTGCCGAGMAPGTEGLAQVWRNGGWGGRQQHSTNFQKPSASVSYADLSLMQSAAILLQEAVLGPMLWLRAMLSDAEAAFTEAVADVPLLARLPVAVQRLVALVPIAVVLVVGVLAVSRLVVTPTPGFALAMAVVGDFGEVGPRRRRGSGLRPRLKKQAAIEMEGQVQKALPNAMFQVALDNGCQVLAHISGKIRRNRIEIFQGDRVKVEISPYDLTRGRITHRNRRTGQGGPAPPGGAPPGGAPAPA